MFKKQTHTNRRKQSYTLDQKIKERPTKCTHGRGEPSVAPARQAGRLNISGRSHTHAPSPGESQGSFWLVEARAVLGHLLIRLSDDGWWLMARGGESTLDSEFKDLGSLPNLPRNFPVTLDRSLNLCEPWFLHLQMETPLFACFSSQDCENFMRWHVQDFCKLSLTIKWAGSLSLKTGPVLWEGGRRKEEKTFELFHILKPGSFVGIAFMYLIKHSLAH